VDKGDSEGRTPSLLNLHQDSDCEGGAEASIRVSSLHIVLLSIFDESTSFSNYPLFNGKCKIYMRTPC